MKNTFSIVLLSAIAVSFALSALSPIKAYAQEEPDRDPLALIENIRNLLNQSNTEFAKGNTTGASELADTAYLDNYEYLEGPLAEIDEELMEETELTIREDLSAAIEEEQSPEVISNMIKEINTSLDEAESLFNSTGTNSTGATSGN
jgi:hypothetical protein